MLYREALFGDYRFAADSRRSLDPDRFWPSGLSGENLDSGLESLNLIIESYTDKIPEIIHSMTYVMMGRIYVKKGETDTARTAFENALKIRYDNPVAGTELQKL